MSEELRSSSVHRNLDSRLKIVGLEAHDLIFVLLFAAIMNVFFGGTTLGIYTVFVIPSILAGILYVGKRNKPDLFLVHLFRFYLMPGYFSAGLEPNTEERRKQKFNESHSRT